MATQGLAKAKNLSSKQRSDSSAPLEKHNKSSDSDEEGAPSASQSAHSKPSPWGTHSDSRDSEEGEKGITHIQLKQKHRHIIESGLRKLPSVISALHVLSAEKNSFKTVCLAFIDHFVHVLELPSAKQLVDAYHDLTEKYSREHLVATGPSYSKRSFDKSASEKKHLVATGPSYSTRSFDGSASADWGDHNTEDVDENSNSETDSFCPYCSQILLEQVGYSARSFDGSYNPNAEVLNLVHKCTNKSSLRDILSLYLPHKELYCYLYELASIAKESESPTICPKSKCPHCMVRKFTVVCGPCGHAFCHQCVQKAGGMKKCVVCNLDVEQMQEIRKEQARS